MDYSQYSVEDLASDHSFIEWATRSNPDSEKYWDDFLTLHPEMRVKIMQARTLVLNLGRAQVRHYPDEQLDDIWSGIRKRIEHSGTAHLQPDMRRSFLLNYIVAGILCLLFVGVVWYTFSPAADRNYKSTEQEQTAESEFIEEVNTSGKVLRLHLRDGSTVDLGHNSRLKYKKHDLGEGTRNVYLTGEAFFDVARDPGRPFLVHSNEVVTRVLGTSFRVHAPDGESEIVVSVKTGKVSVYAVTDGGEGEASQTNAVILLPNQQVVYQRGQDTFGRTLVSDPEILVPSIKDTDFNFENTPAKEVFETLERAYGIEIIFDDQVMANCFFTAPLGSEPLFEKLKIICRAIGARYETIDAKVVVTSTGC